MFLENGGYLMERGFYDLAAFSIEQYCKLLLKHKLLVKTGTYPRFHSLTRLVDLPSRVVPRRYSEVEVRALYRFAAEVFRNVIEGG